MSKFQFPESIKSRPVYGPLEPRPGKAHLMLAAFGDKLRALNPAQYYEGPSYEASVQRLRHVLANAHQGLQVYLTGTESLMGQAQNEAMQAGIPHTSIQTEHRGSVARRMQCVHCKGITEEVMFDPFQCDHCGLHLFVRDHYSRRLAAYQGVCIDAEDPGNVPEPVELYSCALHH